MFFTKAVGFDRVNNSLILYFLPPGGNNTARLSILASPAPLNWVLRRKERLHQFVLSSGSER